MGGAARGEVAAITSGLLDVVERRRARIGVLPERKKVNASSSIKLGSPVKYRIETSIFVGSPNRIRTDARLVNYGDRKWAFWGDF